MLRIIKHLIIIYLIIMYCGDTKKIKQKRELWVYRENSKVFLRINIKDGLFPNNPILAHAVGFKVAWDTPNRSIYTEHLRFTRDVAPYLEDFLESTGINEFYCVLKQVCLYLRNDYKECGFLCQMFNYALRYAGKTAIIDDLFEKCDTYIERCQINLHLSRFTDLY